MNHTVSLRDAERKVFLTATQDGLTDIFIGSIFMIFVFSPLLPEAWGDFWRAAFFIPVWGLLWLGIWLARKYVVRPRIGTVRFGPARKTRLRKFTVVMLVLNVIAMGFGIVASVGADVLSGYTVSALFGAMCLLFASIAAYFLDTRRFFYYGLLTLIAPPIGEWLWQNNYASHHGIPITFGVIMAIIILTGVVMFIRVVRKNPIPTESAAKGES